MSAANTYSGATFVTAGTLALTTSASIASSTNINLANGALFDVSGTTSHAMTLSGGKTISGDGAVNGSFTVASGATLAPGNHDLGALSFSNALTLNPGSRTLLNVSHNGQANNVVSVAGTFTWGGCSWSATQMFRCRPVTRSPFHRRSFIGNFGTGPAGAVPGTVLEYQHLFKAWMATIRVGTENPPVIGNLAILGGQLVLNGSGGITNGTYYVLTATNLTTPVDQLDPAPDQPV